MLFADPALTAALSAWLLAPAPKDRAQAHNLGFEERVSAERQAHFETVAGGASSPTALARGQTDYFNDYVTNNTPDTFLDSLVPARLVPGLLDTAQRIVRLEKVRPDVLAAAGITAADLRDAVHSPNAAVLDAFVNQWNPARDGRPTFAAWKSEVRDALREPNWADLMRDRFGLAHYDPKPGQIIPVLLMEYSVADVLQAARDAAIQHPIVVPTALDSGPWEWFFPSPSGLAYGRTMPLPPDAHRLFTEFLHVKMSYRRDHIAMIGEIRTPVAPIDMRALRNRHLHALRAAAGRPDFGTEIP